MKKTYLCIGTNIGNRKENLAKAIGYISASVGQLIDLSGVYESEPWGFEADEKFLNLVLEVQTSHKPETLLKQCQAIEERMGRKSKVMPGYESRVIDIDILFYNDLVMTDPELTIPHPHIANRRFVLLPLCEIAPDLVHPSLGLTVKEMLIQCPDKLGVTQLGVLDE
jgi:2-amino-4-hydroxy-6-hydroxymethyldihydropteridine diphosphokinase